MFNAFKTIAYRLFIGFCSTTLVQATTTSVVANSENYTRTVASTVWIITSDADNETSTGTGVLVDTEKRIVLTNAHVVGDSRSAVVFFAVNWRSNDSIISTTSPNSLSQDESLRLTAVAIWH
jgi:S1-C subfamily serine protease